MLFYTRKGSSQRGPLLSFFPFSTEEGEHDEHGGEQGGNQAHHGDLGVDGRARGILEGVADGIADDGRLVRVRALAAEVAGLDELLGVVPQAAGVGHKQRQQQTAYNIPKQESADCQRSADQSYNHRGRNGHSSCGNQFFYYCTIFIKITVVFLFKIYYNSLRHT